ncbi:FtsQ-type POTRA domain-containing protein [Luteolibacter ambystomatis]|uniref:FtsQ-type POTRA domain-containing protein n=1 Tax=Luteolibacter ambystomatis TaxID=2824561 RepID=A0A975G9R5_9BACT|nr:FtsQ-type POTRA domain-containing protein [Luteolibacter ambystomatis]QUE51487.1 FtsQ-type POTRA domain-containing protein [Luteolibacter ambystomatis]
MKRRTTNSRQNSRMKRLEVRVMSPRIAWFGFLRACGKSAKLLAALALLGGLAYGGWYGVQRAFLRNPEFQLRQLSLNSNKALDEAGLVTAADLDLHANLFKLDVEQIRTRLAVRPEIASVTVERHLPSTLAVNITARTPKAWLAVSGSDPAAIRREGGLLVDADGVTYACPGLQWEDARDLPVVLVPKKDEALLVAGQTLKHPEIERCFRLLASAVAADPQAVRWIDRLEQANPWSIQMTTRNGTVATFGFDNQTRQITDFVTALDHASREGYGIATISLIPQRNIPITLREEPVPPRATPVPEPTKEEIRSDRRSKDLKSLLNRN